MDLCSFLLICLICFESHVSSLIHYGVNNFSTYIVGDSPIIILSQHGGDLRPDTLIPDRMDGCWNGTTCLWSHSCNESWPRNATFCDATTIKDSYTRDIAVCLQETLETITLSTNANQPIYYKPHLVINELHRSKLDPNREIGEAAQHNSYAQQTFDEIHYEWMEMAKQSNIIQQKCNWGLVIDIHGQRKNEYINLGYALNTDNLQQTDDDLGNYLYRTSMKNVIKTVTNCSSDNYVCPNSYSMADIIRGEKSLGAILNSTWESYGLRRGYLTVPSALKPYLSDGYYAGGPFAINIHGSRYGGIIDFFQLEINRDLRFNETLRHTFCNDFSKALVVFIQQWYDVDSCFEESNVDFTQSVTETFVFVLLFFFGFC